MKAAATFYPFDMHVHAYAHTYTYKGKHTWQTLSKAVASNAILFARSGSRRYLLECDIGSRSVTGTFNKFSTNVTQVKRHSSLD